MDVVGLPVPGHRTGRVMTKAFRKDWITANPVCLVIGDEKAQQVFEPDMQYDGLSEADLKHLRALGYVDWARP